MNTFSTSSNKGFTLLEILLVIAAIGILAAIVLVAINPSRQLAQARNAQRRSDINNILNAVYQKIIDEGASGSTATLTVIPSTNVEILKQGEATPALGVISNCSGTSVTVSPVNMSNVATDAGADIVPTYLASIPQDPSEPSGSTCSGYLISKNVDNRITVTAENTELVADFTVTR